jgi:putative glutamine amidotransferase
VNVAMGGTLHPEIRDLPGRMNHRMPPDGTHRGEVRPAPCGAPSPRGGRFTGCSARVEVMTNTLHGQGIKRPGARIVIDGHAPDGTPEAIYIEGAPGFTLSVQWHPEYRAARSGVAAAVRGLRRGGARLGRGAAPRGSVA